MSPVRVYRRQQQLQQSLIAFASDAVVETYRRDPECGCNIPFTFFFLVSSVGLREAIGRHQATYVLQRNRSSLYP
jgi:hypothetical protein